MASGRFLRERTTIDVIAGLRRDWERTSLPINPVQPVKINFMIETTMLKKDKNQHLIEQLEDTHKRRNFKTCKE